MIDSQLVETKKSVSADPALIAARYSMSPVLAQLIPAFRLEGGTMNLLYSQNLWTVPTPVGLQVLIQSSPRVWQRQL